MGNKYSSGCGCSGETLLEPSWSWKHESQSVIKVLMPTYYNADAITPEELRLARDSYRHILDQTAPGWVALKEAGKADGFQSCSEWFPAIFYKRLFDVHPLCRPMFKHDLKKQGELLVQIMEFILDVFSDEAVLDKRLVALAAGHAKMGIKAIEYGILGEVMFNVLGVVLGSAYTTDTDRAWKKIFSRMLKTIVPVSIAYELKNNEGQHNRFKDGFAHKHAQEASNPSSGCPHHNKVAAES